MHSGCRAPDRDHHISCPCPRLEIGRGLVDRDLGRGLAGLSLVAHMPDAVAEDIAIFAGIAAVVAADTAGVTGPVVFAVVAVVEKVVAAHIGVVTCRVAAADIAAEVVDIVAAPEKAAAAHIGVAADTAGATVPAVFADIVVAVGIAVAVDSVADPAGAARVDCIVGNVDGLCSPGAHSGNFLFEVYVADPGYGGSDLRNNCAGNLATGQLWGRNDGPIDPIHCDGVPSPVPNVLPNGVVRHSANHESRLGGDDNSAPECEV